MQRLLCIVGSMDAGGAETFLMKIYRALDIDKYQMDFCVAKKEKNFYEDEINEMGGKIYRITPKSKNLFKNFNDIKRIVKKNNYKSVMRISQNSLSSLELLAAKLGGAKNIIFRSSNTSVYGNKIEEIIHYIFRPISNHIVNIKIAPSKEAGKFMFGKSKFHIINNGLDLNKYSFSEESREKYREEFNANNKLIIGHVGRFNQQKNHKFLIDIFEKYNLINDNSELWLFGKGELEENIKNYVKQQKLEKKVKFFGVRQDVNLIYSAMDCFVFPSLFEGMPNTVIEAQTSGLPCLVSNTITNDCNITNNVTFLELNNYPEEWAKKILKNDINNRKTTSKIIKEKKYDINDVVEGFVKIVFK